MLQILVHYSLHLLAPLGLAWCLWRGERMWRAYAIMLLTMLVDLDHLFADPIFDPNRMSIGYHPLHSYPMIALYTLMCLLPYRRLGWSWWLRAVGLGLVFHMFTDWQDHTLWRI